MSSTILTSPESLDELSEKQQRRIPSDTQKNKHMSQKLSQINKDDNKMQLTYSSISIRITLVCSSMIFRDWPTLTIYRPFQNFNFFS